MAGLGARARKDGAEEEKEEKMRAGCTTVTFGGTIDQKLKAIAGAGFAFTELWPRDLFEHAEGPEFTLRALQESGLSVSVYQALRNYEGMPEPVRAGRLEIARQLMDQMDLVGAELLALPSNSDPAASGDRARLAGDLRRLGDLAGERGKKIVYEAVAWGTAIADYRDAAELIELADHPAVGLMVDSFHVFARKTPLAAIAEIPAARILHVEVADMPATRLPAIEVSRNYRLFPGEGVEDAVAFLGAVAAAGYRGVTTVEIFNAHYRTQPPGEVAARAFASLAAIGAPMDTPAD